MLIDDLISRAEAFEALNDWEMSYDWDEHCREEHPKLKYIVAPSDVINKLPSKQPEIIRCGECKHMMSDGRCFEFADDAIRLNASDFCSHAEGM